MSNSGMFDATIALDNDNFPGGCTWLSGGALVGDVQPGAMAPAAPTSTPTLQPVFIKREVALCASTNDMLADWFTLLRAASSASGAGAGAAATGGIAPHAAPACSRDASSLLLSHFSHSGAAPAVTTAANAATDASAAAGVDTLVSGEYDYCRAAADGISSCGCVGVGGHPLPGASEQHQHQQQQYQQHQQQLAAATRNNLLQPGVALGGTDASADASVAAAGTADSMPYFDPTTLMRPSAAAGTADFAACSSSGLDVGLLCQSLTDDALSCNSLLGASMNTLGQQQQQQQQISAGMYAAMPSAACTSSSLYIKACRIHQLCVRACMHACVRVRVWACVQARI
jgi:hypothetical protein